MIRVTPTIALRDDEIEESFVRASGPGGQHVNKVSSAVRLRFDVRNSPSLPAPVRERLERLAGQRLTNEGVLVITAQASRSQLQNREEALARLVALIAAAAMRQVVRRPTRPSLGAKTRRLEEKARRGRIKGLRGRGGDE